MTCPSKEPDESTLGFSLLEAMVVLAIVAFVTAIAASALRGPGERIIALQSVRHLQSSAYQARAMAIESGESVSIEVPGCDSDPTVQITYFRDGTASAQTTCIQRGSTIFRLQVNRLTGTLRTIHGEEG